MILCYTTYHNPETNMSCSQIRKHLEAAEEEIRQALIASMENKHEENLTLLVDTLNNVKELLVTTPIRGTDNTTEYYKKNAEHNFKLESPYMDNKVINFPTTIPGTQPHDPDSNITYDFSTDCATNAPITFGGTDLTGDLNFDLVSATQSGESINIVGGLGEDTITFNAGGLELGENIKIDTRTGGDLDKLDDVIDKNKNAADLNDRDGE